MCGSKWKVLYMASVCAPCSQNLPRFIHTYDGLGSHDNKNIKRIVEIIIVTKWSLGPWCPYSIIVTNS